MPNHNNERFFDPVLDNESRANLDVNRIENSTKSSLTSCNDELDQLLVELEGQSDDAPECHGNSIGMVVESDEGLREVAAQTTEIVSRIQRASGQTHTHATTQSESIRGPEKDLLDAVPKAASADQKPGLFTNYPTLPNDEVIDQDSLLSKLNSIADQYRKKRDYLAVRGEYLAISLALNEIGLLAPAFRNQPRLPFGGYKDDLALRQMLVDQIVLDCHWLHCRRERVGARWPEIQELFDAPVFDAEQFSIKLGQRNWSRKFRSNEILYLTLRQQVELLMLCTREVSESRRKVFDGHSDKRFKSRTEPEIGKIRRLVRQWAENVHQIRGQEKVYEALWAARELLDEGDGYRQLAQLAGYMIGRPPLEQSTARSKYKALDSRIATKEAAIRKAIAAAKGST